MRRWADESDPLTVPEAYLETAQRRGLDCVVAAFRTAISSEVRSQRCPLPPERQGLVLAQLMGDVLGQINQALAGDGQITPDEFAPIIAAALRMRSGLDDLLGSLRR